MERENPVGCRIDTVREKNSFSIVGNDYMGKSASMELLMTQDYY
jgi:hypothetical protein